MRLNVLPGDQGPGNAILLTLENEHDTEVFAGFGARMVTAVSCEPLAHLCESLL